MLVKFDLLYPKHVLLKFKKSINRITIFWIFSPFGLVKRLFADLFFIKRGYFLSFFYKETVINRKRKSAILSQLTLLKNDFVGISKSFRLMV